MNVYHSNSFRFNRRPSSIYYWLILFIVFVIAILLNISSFYLGVDTIFGRIISLVYFIAATICLFMYNHLKKTPIADLNIDSIYIYAVPPFKTSVILFDNIIFLDKSHKRYFSIHYHIGNRGYIKKISYFSLEFPEACILALEQQIEHHKNFKKKTEPIAKE